VSDKRQLKKCGNGRSFLVETETFHPDRKEGTLKEPKFEPVVWKPASFNQLEEFQTFFQD